MYETSLLNLVESEKLSPDFCGEEITKKIRLKFNNAIHHSKSKKKVRIRAYFIIGANIYNNVAFPFFKNQDIDAPLATSTPKPTKGKGVKGPDGGKGKQKASKQPPEINIRRLDNSDDDFVEYGDRDSGHGKSVFFNQLRREGVDDDLLENEK